MTGASREGSRGRREEEGQKEKTDGKADKKVFTGWLREVTLREMLQFCFQPPVFLSGDLGQYLSGSWKPAEVTDDPPSLPKTRGWRGLM